jgi:tetratricopeptide (TPR) repeat protein
LQEAYRSYEQVLEREPRNANEASAYVDALSKLASLDLKMGAHERAGQLLTELIRLAPKHNRAHYAYGQVLLYMGREDDAQKAFDEHVRILAAEESQNLEAMGN